MRRIAVIYRNVPEVTRNGIFLVMFFRFSGAVML
jgi:hypothetical protein